MAIDNPHQQKPNLEQQGTDSALMPSHDAEVIGFTTEAPAIVTSETVANENIATEVNPVVPPATEVQTAKTSATASSKEIILPAVSVRERPKRRGLKATAGAALAAIIGVGAFGAGKMTSGNEEEKSPEPKQEQAAPAETPTTVSPEADTTTGNIRISQILPGEPTITETYNGKEIIVPKLRDPSNPKDFMNSVLANISCYWTTGSQKCLDNLKITNSQTLAGLKETYEYYNKQYDGSPEKPNVQVVFFDQPDNPATFRSGADNSGNRYIELSGGRIFINEATDDDAQDVWNGPDTHNMKSGMLMELDEFRVFYKLTGSTYSLTGMVYEFKEPAQ